MDYSTIIQLVLAVAVIVQALQTPLVVLIKRAFMSRNHRISKEVELEIATGSKNFAEEQETERKRIEATQFQNQKNNSES